jgi:hypothetical protein
MRKRIRDDELQALLRRGDPAGDGRSLTQAERQEMRRTVLRAATEPAAPQIARAPAWAAVLALLALAIPAGWHIRQNSPAERHAEATGIAGPEAAASDATRMPHGATLEDPVTFAEPPGRPVRHVLFSTPGGTRVIWTLNPDLKL